MRHGVGRIWVGLVVVLLVASCGSSESSYEVTTTMVSDDTTQDTWVYAPDADGSWPVVFAVPGSGGKAKDLEVLATELASHGVVVFATEWRTASSNVSNFEQDVECGYRFSRTIADEYGGDLTQPVTFVGHSLGATAVLYHGHGAEYGPDGWYDECFEVIPRPDVVVAIAGCHKKFNYPVAVKEWGNPDAEVVLVSGSEDTDCTTTESEHAEVVLLSEGYDVTRVEIKGANHGEFIFRDVDNSGEPLPTDHPTSQETVTIIVDAIENAR
jgi:hypothetical protein